MFLSKKYSKFNKLLEINCYRGRTLNCKKINIKNYFFKENYVYKPLFSFFLFLFKLRVLFRKIIIKKGTFGFFYCFNFLNFFQNYSYIFKNFCFNLDLQTFSNLNPFKDVLIINKFALNLQLYKFISFLFVFLVKTNNLNKQKITYLTNQNIPFLIFSKFYFSNSYSINFIYKNKKQNFWLFLILSLVIEEMYQFNGFTSN